MELLHHGVDQSVIALWLGHESVETTQIYIHADLRLKEKALDRIARSCVPPWAIPSGRYFARLPRRPITYADQPRRTALGSRTFHVRRGIIREAAL